MGLGVVSAGALAFGYMGAGSGSRGLWAAEASAWGQEEIKERQKLWGVTLDLIGSEHKLL